MRTAAALLCVGLAAVACTPPADEPAASQTSLPASVAPRAGTTSPEPTAAVTTPAVAPDDFDTATAMATVRHLAGTIGPREATSPAYERAARWVGRRFDRLGYAVRRQRIAVPAGNSWGVPVRPGRSVNVIATPPGFDSGASRTWSSGAHLDTVPQAPGAEDNASGIGVLLAAAEADGGSPDPAAGRVRGLRGRGAAERDRSRAAPLRVPDLRAIAVAGGAATPSAG